MLKGTFGWGWPGGSVEGGENVDKIRTDGRTGERTSDKRSEKLTPAFSPGKLKINFHVRLSKNTFILGIVDKCKNIPNNFF